MSKIFIHTPTSRTTVEITPRHDWFAIAVMASLPVVFAALLLVVTLL